MKKMIMVSILAVGSLAFADSASIGTEEVIAAGGLTTIVGGCANAQTVGSGENVDIVYTEPCNYAPSWPLHNDHSTVFATVDEAIAACPRPATGYVQAVYKLNKSWKLQVVGFQCAPLTDSNGP